MNKVPVIAVDGPSGTGKGTICSILATNLSWHLLDSGALYRVVALSANQQSIALDDEAALASLCEALVLDFESGKGDEDIRVILNGTEVSEEIRTETCGNAA